MVKLVVCEISSPYGYSKVRNTSLRFLWPRTGDDYDDSHTERLREQAIPPQIDRWIDSLFTLEDLQPTAELRQGLQMQLLTTVLNYNLLKPLQLIKEK